MITSVETGFKPISMLKNKQAPSSIMAMGLAVYVVVVQRRVSNPSLRMHVANNLLNYLYVRFEDEVLVG